MPLTVTIPWDAYPDEVVAVRVNGVVVSRPEMTTEIAELKRERDNWKAQATRTPNPIAVPDPVVERQRDALATALRDLLLVVINPEDVNVEPRDAEDAKAAATVKAFMVHTVGGAIKRARAALEALDV